MDKKPKWRRIVSTTLLIGLFIISIIWTVQGAKVLKGSGVHIESLDSFQIEQLGKLCKVWGLVKYYHPTVVSGKVDWDGALFEVMPKVLETKDVDEVDQILYDWIIKLGPIAKGVPQDNREKVIEADLEWISDKTYMGQELRTLLMDISNTYIKDRDKAYIPFQKEGTFASLKNEKDYNNMRSEDDGYKLLSLFRYWNIIEYYFPYRTVMDKDWNDVLIEFIPKFEVCGDDLSYKLTVSELISQIQDSHASVMDTRRTLYRYWGTKFAPIKFQIIDNQVVITQIGKKYETTCNVKPGDVVLKLNGRDIFEVIEEKLRYVSVSHEAGIVNVLQYCLFRTGESELILEVQRDGKEREEVVQCYNDTSFIKEELESHKLIEEDIGYINPGALKKNEIHSIMKKFKDTKGIIVDLRYYPTDSIVYSLGEYLMPEPTPFATYSVASHEKPGDFLMSEALEVGKQNPDYYKGKVMLIINEFTQSNPEFTAMALRVAPNARVVGSPSTGADGNVVEIQLPGGIKTYISGIGIYYPDGTKTQRIGIIPDVYIRPTKEGIKEGRDELLEKAVQLIQE
nr:S41 family peptidase [uncultured Niameybacter sp.]